MSDIISQSALRRLAVEWLVAGRRVLGPTQVKPGLILYTPLRAADELLLDGFLRPANSIKEALFPKQAKLYGYRIVGNGVELVNDVAQPPSAGTQPGAGPQIVLAARPCDAAALPILDHIFNWDFRDELYNRRRAQTTVITLACASHDENCFCTSVGLNPASDKGSDVLLLALGDDTYEVRCLTDQGRALFDGKTARSDREGKAAPGPEKRFDPQTIRAFVSTHFDDPFWKEQGLTCLGCGACAFACPTCHCFDIVDAGPAAGNARYRTWDTCQFATFTIHASGHNPLADQPARQRQRLLHKFAIYPEKFGEILCTGCGNCTRNCPVGLGVLTVASEIEHG